MDSVRTASALIVSSMCASAMAQDAVQWRVEDGGNGHWYEVVQYGIGRTHAEATALASQVGARLVSIGSEPENAFVESLALPFGVFASFTLGGAQDFQAPDYSEPAGGWRWDDGTTWGFTNWDCGVCAEEIGAGWWCQPDNYIDQHYLVGVICMNRLVWDDGTVNNAERRAIYEWSADCNNDGVVDYGQIIGGQLADANGNGVPDICEAGFPAATSNSTVPTAIVPLRDFDTGEGWTVGIRPNGELTAWGPYSTTLPSGQYRSVSAGGSCAIALRIDGTLVPFGDNAFGRLNVPEGQFRTVSAADATWHAAGVRVDGTIACWGLNSFGQCNAPSGTYLDVAAGGHQNWSPFTVAIRTDGGLAAWGDNTYGQSNVPMGTGYRKVSAGYYHAAALRWDNTIAAWGYNNNGQATAPAGQFVDLSCGSATLALRADGTVLVAGVVEAQTQALLAGMNDCTKVQMICCDGAVALRRSDCDTDGVFDAVETDADPSIDVDQDGVLDACKCAVDSDGDGVLDCYDGCPNVFELQAPVTYHRDADGDSRGSLTDTTAVCSTTPPDGYVADSTDCDDTNAAVYPGAPELCANYGIDNDCDGDWHDSDDAIQYYLDQDCDGYAGDQSVFGCPSGCWSKWVRGDCDDFNPAINPGATELCDGIDNDCNALLDEQCRELALSMGLPQGTMQPGAALVVRVSASVDSHQIVPLIGLQASMRFDATRLVFIDSVPIDGAPLPLEIAQVADPSAGTLRYALGVMPPGAGVLGSTGLFDLHFEVRPDADLCPDSTTLVWFDSAPSMPTMFVANDTLPVYPTLVSAPPVDLDQIAPAISGVPADATVPADAGLAGAVLAKPPVAADDACGSPTIAIIVTDPSGATSSAWPLDSVFPIGTSTIAWTATDVHGNTSAPSSMSITVLPHQLLDATVVLDGTINPSLPAFTRAVRIGIGADAAVIPMSFTPSGVGRTATATGIPIPVSTGTPCIRAKDVAFSLTDLGDVSISGTRYAASFTLRQGDSNDDDAVDILDFGFWYVDFGPAGTAGRSNFNADSFVNTGDFAWLAVNSFQRGETCPGFAPPGAPLPRIAVKELRRRGLGELAAADLNHDGWLDDRDVALALSGVRPPTPATADSSAMGD